MFNFLFMCCFLFVLLFIPFSQEVVRAPLTFLRHVLYTADWLISECLYNFLKVKVLGFGLNLCCRSDPAKDCCGATASRIPCVCVCQGTCQGKKGKVARMGREVKWSFQICSRWEILTYSIFLFFFFLFLGFNIYVFILI